MALILAAVAGISALVSGATTYLFAKNSQAATNEEIKGQIVMVNEAHESKNKSQDVMLISAIVLCVLIIFGLATFWFVKRTYRRARNHADIALQHV